MEAAFVGVALVLAVAAGWVLVSYNRLVRLRTAVTGSWARIDVELQRRHDLVPNLVAVVKSAAGFERRALTRVVEARQRAQSDKGAPPASRAVSEGELSNALRQLFALAESYPQLTATANYRELQLELSNTEDRVAASRSFYNHNVEDYNAARLVLPTRLIASPLGFKEQDYFTAPEGGSARSVPAVDLEDF